MKRAALIEQKEAIRAEIAQVQRAVGRARNEGAKAQRIGQLEARLKTLMAEEHDLRLRIDQAPHAEEPRSSPQERPQTAWLPLLRIALQRDAAFRWQLRGDSMAPTLPITCEIEIVPLPPRVPLGTVIVFADRGALVAHRLVRRAGDYWITQGDGRRGADRPISPDRVLGMVRSAFIETQRCWPGPLSPLHAWFWIGRHNVLRPVLWIWQSLNRR